MKEAKHKKTGEKFAVKVVDKKTLGDKTGMFALSDVLVSRG